MGTNRRRRAVLAVATAGTAIVAGTTVGLAGAGAASHDTPQSTAKATSGGVIKFAEEPSSSPNYIFPVPTTQYVSGYNDNQFMNLMWPELYVPTPTQPTFDFANSIGNAPVWSANDTVATVTLKHYLWSDGTPVVARDLCFFVNLARAEGATYGEYAGPTEFPENVKSCTAVNATTAKFVLDAPVNPTFYEYDGIGYITPLPAQAWDKESASGPVGNYDESPTGVKKVLAFLQSQASQTNSYTTNPLWKVIDGAFELKSFGGASSPDVFVPNPKYSGHKASISEFEEIPFTTDTAEFTSVKAGSSVVNYGYVPSQDFPAIASVKSEGFNVTAAPAWGFAYMIPNAKNPQVGPILSQDYMRQVLAHLTDQGTMITHFMDGYGAPTYGPVPTSPKKNVFISSGETKNLYPYSVSDADKLLKGHDWKIHPGGTDVCEKGGASGCGAGVTKGEKLSFNLLIASGAQITSEDADLFQSDAAAAGVKVSISQKDFDSVIAQVEPCVLPKDKGTPLCNWQLGEYGFLGQSTFPTMDGVFNTGGGFNAGQYSNPTLDKLINESTTAKTLAPFYEAENLVAEQEPWIWLPMIDNVDVTAKNLTGYGLTSEFDGGNGGYLEPNFWYFTK